MWAFRPDERHGRERRGDAARTVGLCITFPNGTRHFVPGSDPQAALAVARRTPAAQWLDHPGTRIEFGTASGRAFTAERVIKAPTPG